MLLYAITIDKVRIESKRKTSFATNRSTERIEKSENHNTELGGGRFSVFTQQHTHNETSKIDSNTLDLWNWHEIDCDYRRNENPNIRFHQLTKPWESKVQNDDA